MDQLLHDKRRAAAARFLTGTLLMIILASACAHANPTLQLIPSIGIAKSTDSNAGDAKAFGGLAVPLTPSIGLDLNGRYIFMQKDNNLEFPTEFNPDFWSASLGLAFKF